MGLGVGSIVSVGGGTSSGGGGSSSGIQTINGQVGPDVSLVGTSGIIIAGVSSNVINIGYDASGVVGVNGIDVQQVGGDYIIDGAGASGAGGGVTKFASSFTAVTSGLFTHNLGTEDVIVQVYNRQTPRRSVIFPDEIVVENSNQVSILFNRPQSGRVVII